MEKSSYLVGTFRISKGRMWGEYFIPNATDGGNAVKEVINYASREEIEYKSVKLYKEIDIINMEAKVLDKLIRKTGFDGNIIDGHYGYDLKDNYEELHDKHKTKFDTIDYVELNKGF